MKKLITTYAKKVYQLKDKIAFFPSILAFLGCLFAYLMMFLETIGVSKYISEFAPYLVISNLETARILLTTFIAGLISIMVFSFSMVMILLNQASSNFSPRLLPGLISNRRHQTVLGLYIATILYCIFILVFIEPSGKDYKVPGFSVLFAIVFMVICLAAFIYFIHSISQEIQINNIMNKIFVDAEKQLTHQIKAEQTNKYEFTDTSDWLVYKATSFGYVQNISTKILKNVAKEFNLKIETLVEVGKYCQKNQPLFKTDSEINEACKERIKTAFSISFEEFIEENNVLAFKHLTEIAVKAMSPGINDPGTAIYAIDYIANLLQLRVQQKDFVLTFLNEEPSLKINLIPFTEVLDKVITSLRTYCKQDILIVLKILKILNALKESTTNENRIEEINNQINHVMFDARKAIENPNDVAKLNAFSISN